MYEPFGFNFYEWWSGLRSAGRSSVALLVLLGGAAFWYFEFEGWLWLSMLAIGTLLIVAAVTAD